MDGTATARARPSRERSRTPLRSAASRVGQRAGGHLGATDAVIEAGRRRLRPILMTTSTTVLGLGPGAEIQAPLARVVIGGLLASTLVTLFLIPVASATVANWVARRRAGRWSGSPREDEQEDESAVSA